MSTPESTAEPNFEGHSGRECGEHRTVGPHRAWCHDCSEWCYPSLPCPQCAPRLVPTPDPTTPLAQRLVQQASIALVPHTPGDDVLLRAAPVPMSLNYTPLRHKMLAAIRDGLVCRGLGTTGWGIRARNGQDLPASYGHCERTVSSLISADWTRTPQPYHWDTPLQLTAVGRATLDAWTSQRGEPT